MKLPARLLPPSAKKQEAPAVAAFNTVLESIQKLAEEVAALREELGAKKEK